jgi:TRAP-type C4-dicarboxylate transport system substrate-binding protein
MRDISTPLASTFLATGIALSSASMASAQAMQFISQNQDGRAQNPPEMVAMEALATAGFDVNRSEFQALGVDLADGLRLVSTGAFNMATIQVGSVARDEPFLEGIDLIGVSTNMDDLSVAVDAFRDVFNARLEEKFGVTAVAIWPFGPQVFLCDAEITSLADLEGLKVRSFTASMSTLLENLGATPVT